MGVKHYKALIFLFTGIMTMVAVLSFNIEKKNKNGLKVLLYAEKDTCFYDDSRIDLSVSLCNEKVMPVCIKHPTLSSYGGDITIKIWHDGVLYVPHPEVCIRSISPRKIIILKGKPIRIKYLLYMRDLIKKSKVDSVSNIINKILKPYEEEYIKSIFDGNDDEFLKKIAKKENIDWKDYRLTANNKKFGTYQIQAIYIKSERDTLYSNIVKIHYLYP